MQIRGLSPVREIIEAVGEESVFHEAVNSVNNISDNGENINNLSASMQQPQQPEQSTPTTTYYEPASCSRADCPLCLISSQEGIMVLVPVSADGSIIRGSNDHDNNSSARDLCVNCGEKHSILECMQL